ncbi:hypothetical protein [Pseudomonas aeruginosa]|uniref:hypothetical protein n=1 Tax=Pseudomonas aeruginosa TaxID=287 RepID=UPI0015E66878|nr:hypothetical protein [Pseudomonas aeruginosa]
MLTLIDATRWTAPMCFPNLYNTDPVAFWSLWASIGVFSAVTVAAVFLAERAGWPRGTAWLRDLLTPALSQ